MFSRACEYAIRAVLHIARHSQGGGRIGLKQIAEAAGSPEAFTAKILQKLVREEVISSVKGPNGGFEMTYEQLRTVKLAQVVAAIDGDQIYRGCGLGLDMCDASRPCPVHAQFESIRNALQSMLETTSVRDLSEGLESGLTFLKR
jgi:Rrf2 family protein